MNLSFKIAGREFGFSLGKSYTSQQFLTGEDSGSGSQGATLNSPYAQSAWVYCATSILAQTVAQVPFRISQVSGGRARQVRSLRDSAAHRAFVRKNLNEEIVTSGDVVDLFNQPHPTMDRQMFFELLVTWLCLRGEFFVTPLDLADSPVDLTQRSPRIKRLLTLNPDKFWHVVRGFDLTAWRYTGSPLMSPLPSEMFQPGEIIQSKLPNPYLYWRGMSPLTVALAPAATDFAGEQFQKGLWLNNADTGVIVTTDQILADDQRRAIESALRERKRKAGTPDRPLFLFGGAKIEKPTLSMMDMQFLETRKFLRQEIFAILKVPESLAGFTSDLNDGGAGGSLDAQKASFIESTITSLCQRIECALAPVVTSFGSDLVGWFDVDSLPIMQAARRTRWDTGTKMFAMGVPLADINTNLDLGLPAQPWYAKGYLPFNLQEAGAPAEPLPSEDDPNEPEPDADPDDATKSNPFARMQKLLKTIKAHPPVEKVHAANLWKKRMNFRKSHVNLFAGKIGKVLMRFRAKALAKLDEAHLRKDFSDIAQKSLVDVIFSAVDFGQALNGELEKPIAGTLQASADNMRAEMGLDDPWKYPSKDVLRYIHSRTQRIQDCGATVRNQLNTSLAEGVANGETHEQLAARVKEVFNDLVAGEAKRIARTEVNSAASKGGFFAMTDAGIEYKSWLGSHGPHAREEHQAVEDATIDNPIPVDEPFEVDGEQMMHPLDDSLGASPGNVINCQCDVLAAQKVSEDEKTVTFKIFGAGVMSFNKVSTQGGRA
jgi:HK97 family phage portal protein